MDIEVLYRGKNKELYKGQRIGCLTLISKGEKKLEKTGYYSPTIIVECDCGNVKTLTCYSLANYKSVKGRQCDKCAGKISGIDCLHIFKYYFTNLKKGAIRRNLEIEITMNDIYNKYIEQNKKCALSGLDIYFKPNETSKEENTASVDRIDSSKGYLINNIQIVHKDINKIKQNFTDDYFKKLCESVYKNSSII